MKKLLTIICLLVMLAPSLWAADYKTGTIASTTSVTTSALVNQATAYVYISGTWVATLQFEGTVDGTNYFNVNGVVPTTYAVASSATANGSWIVSVAGLYSFRVRASAYTSGTVNVAIRISEGPASSVSSATVSGAVDQGSSGSDSDPWNVVTTDTANTPVKTGDASNNATRVNIVAGIQTEAAHGAADSGNPAKIGFKAITTEATVVDDADRTNSYSTLDGKLMVKTEALPGDYFQNAGEETDTSWHAMKAGEATYYLCLTDIYVQNSDASVATDFFVYDDDDGDVGDSNLLWSGYAAALGGGGKLNSSAAVRCTETAGNGLYIVAETTSSELKWSIRGYRTKVKPVE